MNKFIEYTDISDGYIPPERIFENELIEIRLYCHHPKCSQYIKGVEGYNGRFIAETGQMADLRNQSWECEKHTDFKIKNVINP